MEGERNSSTVGEGIGVGDSCAKATEAKTIISNAKVSLVVMSSEVETSLIFIKNVERFDSLISRSLNLRSFRLCRGFPSRSILDFARNDKR
jgi:hypothetical protein